MRKTHWLWCVLVVVGAVCSTAAQDAEHSDRTVSRAAQEAPKPAPFVGTWSGTWEGAGSGGAFELIFEQDNDGPVTGRVAVTGEPAYKVALRSLSFDATKMSARYDFPADESAEVVLAASFEGNKATGSWSLQAKGTDPAVASGTWTVTRK